METQCEIGGSWSTFDPSISVCFYCKEETQILSKEEAESKVCCDDGSRHYLVTERTQCQDWPRNNAGIACNNGNMYLDSEWCDGYNHCRDGSDERSCELDCMLLFRCSISDRTQCFPSTKVCDGVKDCLEGADEMNCIYHSGSCDGYRCIKFHECVDRSQICDGVKDCLDGSDEQGCILGNEEPFFCSGNKTTGETVAMERVCNGSPDCSNDLDEVNCWVWTQWSLWSACDCKPIATQLRNRTCTNADQRENRGQCGNGSTVETQNCKCTQAITSSPTTETQNAPLELQWIIVIVLATLVLVVAIVGMLYGAWYNEKANKAMEEQVRTVTSMYTQSAFSLTPAPVVVTPQQPTSFFPPSPHPIRPMRIRTPGEPLPITPLELINHTYESIEASHIHDVSIDPYAATRFQSSVDEDSEGITTVVQTYQTSPEGSLSGDDYDRTPPPVPEAETVPQEKYGYLVAMFSENKHECKIPGNLQGVTYVKTKKQAKTSRKRTPVKLARSRIQSQKYYHSDEADQHTTIESANAHRANSTPTTPCHFGSKASKVAIRRVRSTDDFIETNSMNHLEGNRKMRPHLDTDAPKIDQEMKATDSGIIGEDNSMHSSDFVERSNSISTDSGVA